MGNSQGQGTLSKKPDVKALKNGQRSETKAQRSGLKYSLTNLGRRDPGNGDVIMRNLEDGDIDTSCSAGSKSAELEAKRTIPNLSCYNPAGDDAYRRKTSQHRSAGDVAKATRYINVRSEEDRRVFGHNDASPPGARPSRELYDDNDDDDDTASSSSDDSLASCSDEIKRIIAQCPIIQRYEHSLGRHANVITGNSSHTEPQRQQPTMSSGSSLHKEANSSQSNGRYTEYAAEERSRNSTDLKRKSDSLPGSKVLSQLSSIRGQHEPANKMSRFCAFEQRSRNMSKF